TEPTNLLVVTVLPPGERKSQVVDKIMEPVRAYEREEQVRMAPLVAERESEHRVLEKRLQALENRAAKAEDASERDRLKHEVRQLARELEAHRVPEPPQFFCDDVTPEALTKLLARQGGRMLQAGAEGTAFEIMKGRYSEGRPNFDVYLKG